MNYFKCVISLLAFLSCTGCSTTSTPTCTDDTVKKLVLQITNSELFKQLLPDQLQANYSELTNETNESEVYKEYKKIDQQGAGFVWGTMPVEEFMKFVKISPTARAMKEKIDQQIKEIDFSISAIRTSSQKPDIKKIYCESNLVSANGKKLPIRYTAQSTEDKHIWVEVSGM